MIYELFSAGGPLAPERRFAALAQADRRRLSALAEAVLDTAEVEVVVGPRVATMLLELTESVRGEPFHLGEVVVSEAEVRVDGHRGDGLVLGFDPEAALAAAVCDGAAEAGVFAGEVAKLVEETEAALGAARAAEAAIVKPTRARLEVIG